MSHNYKYTRKLVQPYRYSTSKKKVTSNISGRKLIYSRSYLKEYDISIPFNIYKFLKKYLPFIAKKFLVPVYKSEDIVFYNPLKEVIDTRIRSRHYGKKDSIYTNLWFILYHNPKNNGDIFPKEQIDDPKIIKLLNNEVEDFIMTEPITATPF